MPAVPGAASSGIAYVAEPVFSAGSNCSPRPAIVPGPEGTLMTLGLTPDLSARAIPPAVSPRRQTAAPTARLLNCAGLMGHEEDDVVDVEEREVRVRGRAAVDDELVGRGHGTPVELRVGRRPVRVVRPGQVHARLNDGGSPPERRGVEPVVVNDVVSRRTDV